MRPGSSANLMYLIFAFGDALHMSSFRRTSDALFSLTWRNASSWDTLVVTKVGYSTIPTHRNMSSLNGQSLMNAFFLAYPSTRHHHQSLSHHLILCLSYLQQLLTWCSIWGGIVRKMTAQLRLYHMFQLQNSLLLIHLLICHLLPNSCCCSCCSTSQPSASLSYNTHFSSSRRMVEG